MEFWNDIAIEKSWKVLIGLRKEMDFILIGGWACYLLTHTIKSKDIDIIVDFEGLEKLRKKHPLKKTPFLKKYEALIEGISIEIYVPFYSDFAIPPEEIQKFSIQVEGFRIPEPETLLILKQQAELARKDSVKGQKDRVDIINLLMNSEIDLKKYLQLLQKFKLVSYKQRLKEILLSASREFQYLGIQNPREIKLRKKRLLEGLKE